jgi:hypothetical protein
MATLYRLLLLVFLGASSLSATTTLTVHNLTGRTLAVTQEWSPWRPEPDDPPPGEPFFQRWLKPGAVGTYVFEVPGKDLESVIIIRTLPLDGAVVFERLTLQAVDPGGTPFGDGLATDLEGGPEDRSKRAPIIEESTRRPRFSTASPTVS